MFIFEIERLIKLFLLLFYKLCSLTFKNLEEIGGVLFLFIEKFYTKGGYT